MAIVAGLDKHLIMAANGMIQQPVQPGLAMLAERRRPLAYD
jgi:hypothetical protein